MTQKKKKNHTKYTKIPLLQGLGKVAVSNLTPVLLEMLILGLKHATCPFLWWKALAIALRLDL